MLEFPNILNIHKTYTRSETVFLSHNYDSVLCVMDNDIRKKWIRPILYNHLVFHIWGKKLRLRSIINIIMLFSAHLIRKRGYSIIQSPYIIFIRKFRSRNMIQEAGRDVATPGWDHHYNGHPIHIFSVKVKFAGPLFLWTAKDYWTVRPAMLTSCRRALSPNLTYKVSRRPSLRKSSARECLMFGNDAREWFDAKATYYN